MNNNWVSFAGFYWRIIRINGDGSIRIIYSGEADSATPDSTNTTGSSTMINSSQAFNSSRNRSEYVGYMYTSGQQHGNTTNSDIKTVVDNWYNSNLKSQESKISKEAGFCGDRNLKSGSWRSTGSSHDYAAYGRLIDNKTPTLKCSNSNDLYTTSSSSKGNKALTNPIGLITADEVAMAGGVYATSNSSYYLYNGEYYWTMSPYLFSAAFSSAYVFYVDSSGNFNGSDVDYTRGVRPVINLAHDVVIKSGNGTSSTPYEI